MMIMVVNEQGHSQHDCLPDSCEDITTADLSGVHLTHDITVVHGNKPITGLTPMIHVTKLHRGEWSIVITISGGRTLRFVTPLIVVSRQGFGYGRHQVGDRLSRQNKRQVWFVDHSHTHSRVGQHGHGICRRHSHISADPVYRTHTTTNPSPRPADKRSKAAGSSPYANRSLCLHVVAPAL